MRKKMIGLLCLVILASGSMEVYAKQLPSNQCVTELSDGMGIMPLWTNISVISSSISFVNGKASVSGSVVGQPGTTSITVNAILERLNANGTYTHIKTWDGLTSSNNLLYWGTDYYVARGYTYRMTIEATVVRDGTTETASVSKSNYAD